MNNLTFNSTKSLDIIALGRLCIDLNANEIDRPMEETVTFTKCGRLTSQYCYGDIT